ncbi:S-layer homology domain-containing protein [Microcoleus sp. FACHB-831]|uniref:S-layer homology domain-containing protein n=1 Tax=Microcoleus sp. FACHB-831 TaxID=2692827 RepID=UPI001F55642F|nr:S-layer homology domain-containing protein [Microcoleus sp. FACHB-831]
MMPGKFRGRFYQSKRKICLSKVMLISAIAGFAAVNSAGLGVASTTTSNAKTTAPMKGSGSVGKSMLSNLLGAEHLCLKASCTQKPSTAPTTTQKSAKAVSTAKPTRNVAQQKNIKPPIQVAQGTTFRDIQGNWARTFIEALAAGDIIKGFPDGTFRPDEPVTRSQFAAMIRKAFRKAPIREAVQFADVPANYWGYTAIQEAYQTGFLEGYPNRIFSPNQNIPRVQVLVSLVTGLNLNPTSTTAANLNNFFQDANEIPGYALNQIAAAAENQIVVNYPSVNLLSPNRIATRADLAAFIYQALVKAGTAPALNANDIAAQYIVGYQPPVAQQPSPAPEPIESVRQRLRLPSPPVVQRVRRIVGGASSLSTPTGFGADRNAIYVGGTYQGRTRYTGKSDGAVAAGLGVGDARKALGFEATVTSYSTFRTGFGKNGGVSFKVHRLLPSDIGVAVGVENFDTWGHPDPEYSSVYGVISKVFPLVSDETAEFSPSITASVGVGGGRFRSEADVFRGRDSVNVFGSVGARVAEPISLIADWTGQDLNLGVSILPFPNIPLVITPGVADVTGNAGDGARFILGVGYGVSF